MPFAFNDGCLSPSHQETTSVLGGTLRFSDWQRRINEISVSRVTPKMLTQELRQMEADGLVHREVYAQVPPKVEYSLRPLGMSLRPVVDAMVEWGRQHARETEGGPRPCQEENPRED